MASELTKFAEHQMVKLQVPLIYEYGGPGGPCLICDRPVTTVEFPYQQLGVCSGCAECISENFHMAHSGAYFLWKGRSA